MSLVALLTVLIFCFGISTNAQDVKSLWFAPGVPITRVRITRGSSRRNSSTQQFQATVTVPSLPSGGGAHGIWPGVENDGAGFVFQAVISDSKSQGAWEFWVEFCCK